MSFTPRPYEIYKHFKGNLYQITAIAEHSENGEPLVVYQALYGDYKIYARPLAMFLEKVDFIKYPEAKQTYRFERQSPKPDPRLGGEEKNISAGSETYTDTAEACPAQAEPEVCQEVTSLEETLDPLVLEFLDADSYEERLRILTALQPRITDGMITTMAIACDLEVPDGSTAERLESLRACLVTLEKYECNRLR